jgi:TIR domain
MDMISISVFISYRREDSLHQAGRLYDHLVAHFGSEHVFKDVVSIPLGLDFREILTERVGGCDVFLAVIGDAWLSVTGKGGIRRLEDANDFVRIEIEAALDREIPVIPVLVGNSPIPPPEDLPESLRRLSFRNGIFVRPDPDFRHDVDRLIRGINDVVSKLREHLGSGGPEPQKPRGGKSAANNSPIESRVSPTGAFAEHRGERGAEGAPFGPQTAPSSAVKKPGWLYMVATGYVLSIGAFLSCVSYIAFPLLHNPNVSHVIEVSVAVVLSVMMLNASLLVTSIGTRWKLPWLGKTTLIPLLGSATCAALVFIALFASLPRSIIGKDSDLVANSVLVGAGVVWLSWIVAFRRSSRSVDPRHRTNLIGLSPATMPFGLLQFMVASSVDISFSLHDIGTPRVSRARAA